MLPIATSVEVFLHKPDSFGERYLGLQGAASALLILFWPAFCSPIHDPERMTFFLLCYFMMTMAIRARFAIRRRRKQPQPHSRYNGRPWLMTRRMDESKVKCVVEPFFTFFAGGCIGMLNVPLGAYLMFASLGLLVSNGLTEAFERQRTREMHDAYLEQRRLMERFRELRGD